MVTDKPMMVDPIDESERVIRARSGVVGLWTVAAFLRALPSGAILSWGDGAWTPADVLGRLGLL